MVVHKKKRLNCYAQLNMNILKIVSYLDQLKIHHPNQLSSGFTFKGFMSMNVIIISFSLYSYFFLLPHSSHIN